MRLWRKTHEIKETDEDIDADLNLWTLLAGTPWKAEDHPQVAEWLKERNVVLDYFGHCVRKPNYVCWRQKEKAMYEILLPEVQANREFARDLRIRVTYRLGLGDVEGAWYDVMSMLTLARKHYKNDPILVTNLVGASAEREGYNAAKIVLRQGNLTRDQLSRFAKDLNALPSANSFSTVGLWSDICFSMLSNASTKTARKFTISLISKMMM